jgi:hypothetical protein
MSKLQELMESEEMGLFVENNQEVIAESSEVVNNFIESLVEYVVDNPIVFIESDVEDMKKNIRVFAETAVEQFLHEITAMNAENVKIVEPITPENALNDYI